MKIEPQYLAGFVDGEGTLVFRVNTRKGGKRRTRISAALSIHHTHLPVLRAISECWGGSIYPHKSTSYKGAKQGWMIHWQTQDGMLKVLTAIQPYLIVKKPEVDYFMLEYVPTMKSEERPYRMTDEQYAKRFEVRDVLTKFKQVEFPIQ